MAELLVVDPYKLFFFFLFVSLGASYVFMNLRNPKRLFYVLVFYLPLSFKTNSGSLAMYLAIMLFLILIVVNDPESKYDFKSFDSIIVLLILVASLLSIVFAETHTVLFVLNKNKKIMLNPRYVLGITMFSNVILYFLAKRFISTKEDLIKIIKYVVFSASIASLAAYLQLINKGLFLFKYIVISENPYWAKRIGGTMQGYEILAEYTAILIILSIVLFLLANKKSEKILYLFLILNFFIILTLTQTRGIYVAGFLTMIYLIFVLVFSGKFKLGLKYLAGIVLVSVILISAIFIVDQFRPESRFIERFTRFERINLKKGSFDTRNIAWQRGLNYISEMSAKEKIIGANNKYLGQGEIEDRVRTAINWPHCLYMSIILRDGYLGLILFFVYLGWLYKQTIYGIIRQKSINDRDYFIIGMAFHMILILLMIDEIKIEFIRHDRTQNIYWIFFGIMSAFSVLMKREKTGTLVSRSQNVT